MRLGSEGGEGLKQSYAKTGETLAICPSPRPPPDLALSCCPCLLPAPGSCFLLHSKLSCSCAQANRVHVQLGLDLIPA